MSRLEVFKEHYLFEIRRKNRHNNDLAIPVAILFAVVSALGYYTRSYAYGIQGHAVNTAFFLSAIVLTTTFVSLCFVWIYRSIHGYQYEYVSVSVSLQRYYEHLQLYHKAYGGTTSDVELDFEESLIGAYASANETNQGNNDSKSGHLDIARKLLLIAVILTVVTTIPYTLNTYIKLTETPNIAVSELEKR